METQHWIEAALESGYIDQKTNIQLVGKCLEMGRMLNGMMEKADMFCGEPPRTLHEESAEYFVDSNGSLPTDDGSLVTVHFGDIPWQQKS